MSKAERAAIKRAADFLGRTLAESERGDRDIPVADRAAFVDNIVSVIALALMDLNRIADAAERLAAGGRYVPRSDDESPPTVEGSKSFL